MRGHEAPARNAGFTLVEAIVAFAFLSMVLGAVMLSLSRSARLHVQGDAGQATMACAQRVLAERLDRRAGLAATESGTDGADCRWRVERRLVRASYTASGRNLMAFRLEVLGPRRRVAEVFDTYYVEEAR